MPENILITADEAQTIRDLLEAYLADGTHPVDIAKAEALQTRLWDLA